MLEPLAARDVEIMLAVFPTTSTRELRWALAACGEAEIPVHLWPMLEDADGRWAHRNNLSAFQSFTRATLKRALASEVRPRGLVLDIEPPLLELRALVHGDPRPLARRLLSGGAFAGAPSPIAHSMSELALEARRAALEVSLTAAPPLASEPLDGGHPGWQRLLDTPIDALCDALCDAEDGNLRINAMAYTSVLQGYGRRFLRRRDTLALLSLCVQRYRLRYGAQACISLGATNIGALGDEAIYSSPQQLAEDVAIVRGGGIEDIALFELAGAVSRPPLSDWLDALVDTDPSAAPPISPRARGVAVLSRLIAEAFGRTWSRAPGS